MSTFSAWLRHGRMGMLVAGLALIGVSVFMLLGFFTSSAAMTVPVAVLTLLVAVGIPAAAGGALLRSYFRQSGRFRAHKERLRLETLQAEIVRVAGQKRGKLTVVELVSELAFDPGTTEAALQDLVTRGVADVEVTDSGLLVYTFPEVQRLAEKDRSRGILDD